MIALKNEQPLATLTISEIIGRDAGQKLKLQKPEFNESKEVKIDFWRKGIKWLFSIKKEL